MIHITLQYQLKIFEYNPAKSLYQPEKTCYNLNMVLSFPPFTKSLTNEEILHAMLTAITDTISLRPLLLSMVIHLSKHLMLSNASFFLYDANYDEFALMESIGFQTKKNVTTMTMQNPIVRYLKSRNDFLVLSHIHEQLHRLKRQKQPKPANVDLLSRLEDALDNVKGEITVPFSFDNKLIGILVVGAKHKNQQFNKNDLILLKRVADSFVSLINGAKLYEESKQHESELSALYEVSKVISASFELAKTMDIIARNASILLKAPKVLIILGDETEHDLFVIRKSIGFSDFQLEQIHKSVHFKRCTHFLTGESVPRLYTHLDESDPYNESQLMLELNIHSLMSIPLYNEDLDIIGELRVMRSPSQKWFISRELDLAINLANNVTIALKNANLYHRSENQLTELSKVYNITKSISAEFDLKKLEQKLCSIFVGELGFDRVMLLFYNESSKTLFPVAAIGWELKVYENMTLDISRSIEGRALVEGRMISIFDALKDPRLDKKVVALLDLKTFLVIPLITKKKPVGVILATFHDPNVIMEPLISSITNHAAIAIENSQLYQESALLNEQLKKEQLRTERELEIASYVQQSILSAKMPDTIYLNIAASAIPCRAIGGDFYNFIEQKHGTLGVAIGDVSGKGIPAALLMNLTSGIFNELGKQYTSPEQILDQANQTLMHYFKASPSFYVTAFYGTFDFSRNLFQYCKAGHNPPILYRAEQEDVFYLDTEGVYLGPFADGGFIEKKVQINNGDKLILYTDGLTEVRNKNRELFTKERLVEIIKKNKVLSAEALHKLIIREVNRFNNQSELSDDMTLVVIGIKNLEPVEEEKVYTINYKVPSKLIEVKEAIKDFLSNLQQLKLSQKTFNYIRLALSEAAMNAYEHGNKKNSSKQISITGYVTDVKIELSVQDEGEGFDPGTKILYENQLDIGNRGRGIAVINGCMDHYSYNENGNKLTFIKYF